MFRSIPSSCRIDLKAGAATFTVAVHEAHSSLVNVNYWPKAGMTLRDSDVCFRGAFNQSPTLLARADEVIE